MVDGSIIRPKIGKGDGDKDIFYNGLKYSSHTVDKFNEFKGKMKLKISNGLIEVTNNDTNELIISHSDSRILKWELTKLSVSSGKVRFIN